MLVARATTIACRLEFPDVIRGMAAAELADDERPESVTVHAEVIEPQRAPRTTAAAVLAASQSAEDRAREFAEQTPRDQEWLRQHDPAYAQMPAPAADQTAAAAPLAPEPEPEEQRYVLPVSKPQLDSIKARLEDLGLGGRAAAARASRMQVLSHLVGREIDDPRALTGSEAKACLAGLAGDAGVEVCYQLGIFARPEPAPAPVEVAVEHADAAGYDPTAEPEGWGTDGVGAEAEGR